MVTEDVRLLAYKDVKSVRIQQMLRRNIASSSGFEAQSKQETSMKQTASRAS
jgi:hypothetical protein